MCRFSDGCIYVDNDDLSAGGAAGGVGQSYRSMNAALAADLASVLFPLSESASGGGGAGLRAAASVRPWRPVSVGVVLASAAPLPRLRFLALGSSLRGLDASPAAVARRRRTFSASSAARHGVGTDDDWRAAGRRAARASGAAGARPGEACAGAFGVVRGREASERALGEARGALLAGLSTGRDLGFGPSPPPWRDPWFGGDWSRDGGTPALHGLAADRSVGWVANRSSFRAKAAAVLGTAARKYACRAYVHWYARYGLEHDDFACAFEALVDVAEDYASLEAPVI